MLPLQAHAPLDVLQVVSLRLFDLFPDDVRQHGVPDLSGRCGCCIPAGLIFGIAGAFVAYCFIGQYFLTTHPDYNVAVVSPYYLPEATVTALQEQLAAYGEDCSGDGQQLLADYYIGIRGAWLKESASLLENSEPLWANLTAGEGH